MLLCAFSSSDYAFLISLTFLSRNGFAALCRLSVPGAKLMQELRASQERRRVTLAASCFSGQCMLLADGEVQARRISIPEEEGMVLTIMSMAHLRASFLDEWPLNLALKDGEGRKKHFSQREQIAGIQSGGGNKQHIYRLQYNLKIQKSGRLQTVPIQCLP